MATWAIGDVQGCFATLERLLRRINYRRGRDRLLFAGDLVNRGPDSLRVLRWARDQGDSVTTVLGNHDLHLLACRAGIRLPRGRDTLAQVLDAPDADALCDWLASRPFLHREGRFLLLHGGFLPGWSAAGLAGRAANAAEALRGRRRAFLKSLYRLRAGTTGANDLAFGADGRGRPDPAEASPLERAAGVARILTCLRLIRSDGMPDFGFDGTPETIPPGRRPWFEAASLPPDQTVLFGHWSALGLTVTPRAVCLDSGCVWNGFLTAMRLSDGALRMEPAALGDARRS